MKTSGDLECTQDGGRRSTGIPETPESHAITNKYPDAASVAQQVYRVLGDIENLQAKVGVSSEWTSIVSNAQNRANFCKGLDGKPRYHGFVMNPDSSHPILSRM
jgi:hypothetical protein